MRPVLRLRTVTTIGSAAIASAILLTLYLALPRLVGQSLQELLPPGSIAMVVGSVRAGIVLAAIGSLGIFALVGYGFGGALERPLTMLRHLSARAARGEIARVPRFAIEELHALGLSIARTAEEHSERVRQLEVERDALVLLIDRVGDGIVQIREDGRILRTNQIARDMLGLPDDVDGRPVASLIRNADVRVTLEASALGRVVPPFEILIDDRRILLAGRPLGPDGTGGAVVVLVDLTELRRLEGVRRDFVANASHELKTPLTSIRGYSETLLTDDVPEPTRRLFLETIHKNSERLQRVVDDLLDLSRIESGTWRPDLQEVDLAEVAREAWGPLQHRAATGRIDFLIQASGAHTVLGDPFALGQIFSNLLDNAVRYTPPGGRISVHIGRTPPDQDEERPAAGDRLDRITVEVRDTGSGIPGDSLPRLFERFYRVDPARSRAEGGTGLGLAIVKHSIESMGGDVVAESKLGRGTTIRFRLPAAIRSPVPG